MTTIKIGFGSADYDYSIVHGTLAGSGGNPGGCLDGGIGGHDGPECGNPTRAAIRVNLPPSSTVTRVMLDRWKEHTPPYNNSWTVLLYDQNDTLLATPISGSAIEAANTWFTADSGGISVSNVAYAHFEVGTCWAPVDLHSRMDNCVIEFTPGGQPEQENPGQANCDETGTHAGEGSTDNPIGIRHGEKREAATDLSLNTPTGRLELVRTYSQYRQAELQFMGLGWNHNHQITLTPITGTPNKLVVRLPEGGEAHYSETTPGSNHYVGVAGVGSSVDWNVSSSQYILTAPDKTIFVFNSGGNLLSRTWPTGDTWTYSYSSGKLSEINDGYGRKLVFRYYTSGSHTGQLYRVGDHTFSDTNPTSPIGRYVEYGYTLNKTVNSSGSIVNGTASLLTSVKDVRGNTWTYDYYGQDGGETDPRQLNFLMGRTSPSVDTTGDSNHTPDSTLVLEAVNYTLQESELAVNGGMEADSNWTAISGAAPTTNAYSTTQFDSGTHSRHIVTSAAGQGIEGEAWNIARGKIYIVTAKVYPVSGIIKMQVTGSNTFDQVSSGTGAWQLLRAVYNPIAAATGRKLQFVASGGASEFYVDTVSIKEVTIAGIHQERGDAALVTDYAFQPSGQNITTETTAGNVTTHRFFDGVYAGPEDPAGNFTSQVLNSQYRPIIQQDANGNATILAWSTDGKRLTQVADALGNGTQFAYDGNERLQSTQDAEGRKTIYFYEATSRQPSLIVVADTATDLVTNGGMEADSDWAGITGAVPATNERLHTQVDSENHTRHVVASAANQGIEGNSWDLVANQTYTIRARVFPVSGAVKMHVTGETAFDQTTSGTGQWQTLTATYTPTSGATGKQLQFTANGGAAEFYVDSVSISTLGELAINGGMEADSDWANITGAAPTTNERSNVRFDSGAYSRHVVASAANQGIEGNSWDLVANQTYTIRARVFPVSGSVQMQVPGIPELTVSTAETGAWQTLSAVHAPGSSLTGKKLQFVALAGAAEFYVDSVSISLERELASDGGMESDTLYWTPISGAAPTTNERQPRVDSGDYMRHVLATALNQGIEGAAWNVTANHTYLISARVYVLKNTTNPAHVKLQVPGIAGFDKITSSTNTWEAVRVIYKPTSSAAGVKLQFVASTLDDNSRAEFYVDTVHVIDLGVIADSIQDRVRWQEFAYDRFGRTVLEASISPLGASPIQQVTRSYASYGKGSGLLRQVIQEDVSGSNDVTTTYTYDAAGRVVKTQQSTLAGDCCGTLTEYDSAGNVLSITNRRDPSHPNDPILNPITAYEYDTLGRRIRITVNSHTKFAQTTLTVYDALNRVIRTIANYKPVTGVSNPYTVARSAFDGQHGADNTENLVTDTAYNSRGMVKSQTDVLGNVTFYGYDEAGRLIKTIQNASRITPSYYDNDYSGDPTLGSYTPISDPDKDIITIQGYDAVGNLVKTVDPLGTTNYMVYDALNRPMKTVRAAKATATINPSDPGYNVANDPRSTSYMPSTNPDRDLIDTTEYDAMGRVIRTQRLLENRPTAQWDTTLYGYDTLGRQVKVIRSASNPIYDIASDPDLSAYSASSNPDQDIITQTVYDANSRVQHTEDPLQAKTRLAYDGLGRQIKSIANYMQQGASEPATWVWDATDNRWEYPTNNPIVHGTNNDQNIITETVSDANGRVQLTRDVLGRAAYTVYDTLGRVIRRITNYVAQGSTNPQNWVWSSTNNRWEYSGSDSTPIDHDSANNPDQNIHENIIADTVYDDQGRVLQTFDNRHNTTFYVYDMLGHRIKTIANYVVQGSSNPVNWLWDAADNRWEDGAGNAISLGSDNDQNRISATSYNKGGQVVTTTDARGTQTALTYDKAGRRLTVTQAVNSPLASVSYTSYDKAGRVLRTIRNWSDDGTSPDAKDSNGNWLFAPNHNGAYNDRNLITARFYDAVGRPVRTVNNFVPQESSNPANWTWNVSTASWEYSPTDSTAVQHGANNDQNLIMATSYDKDGHVISLTDPEGVVIQHCYDGLRRSIRVVEGYIANGEDPGLWVWNSGWKKSDNTTPIQHTDGVTTNEDRNVIVDVTYDKAGRVTKQREPRGNETLYAYDQLDRRTSLTNPLSNAWTTKYVDLAGGKTRASMSYPGINGGGVYTILRDFDRLGRLASIQYGAPGSTPDVKFTYDAAGNRSKMSEYSAANFTTLKRETLYSYDDAHRLTSAAFDTDGNGVVNETVAYEYDAGGLKTKLTIPGSLNITYTYDTKGQLISLTDWDNQKTTFGYDLAGRQILTERPNNLRSRYHYNAAGHLKLLRHTKDTRVLAHFDYQMDRRGNRTQALEVLANPTTTTDTTVSYSLSSGTWVLVGGFQESVQSYASIKMLFLGDEATLTMGTGPDHGIYDVYVGGSLWQSFDGYTASAGQRDIIITAGIDSRKLQAEGPHLVEIRNRAEKNKSSSGYKIRFKQMLVADRTWTLNNISYKYDNLSRLLEGRYSGGLDTTLAGNEFKHKYDRAGNRTERFFKYSSPSQNGTYFYSYNNANQFNHDQNLSYGYDNNGNRYSAGGSPLSLTQNTTWDHANRMLSYQGTYVYDGLGNRVQQTVSSTTTQYLLDVQPGLTFNLAETVGANVTRFVHAAHGLHAQKTSSGNWQWMLEDGLGSVRMVLDSSLNTLESRTYEPDGAKITGLSTGTSQTLYGFTGERHNESDALIYLRARYYNEANGVFMSLDSLEIGNRYQYANANPVNYVDHNGLKTAVFDPAGATGDFHGPPGTILLLDIPWEGPTLYGSWNPVGTGVTGIAPISELTWAQSTFGLFSDTLFSGFTVVPPQGDYIGLDTQNAAGYLNGAMCPNLSPANQALVLEALQMQQQVTTLAQPMISFQTIADAQNYLKELRKKIKEDTDCSSNVYRIQTRGARVGGPLQGVTGGISWEIIDPDMPVFTFRETNSIMFFIFDNPFEVIRWLTENRTGSRFEHYVVTARIKRSFVDAVRLTAVFQDSIPAGLRGWVPQIADPSTSYSAYQGVKFFTSFGLPRSWAQPHMENAVRSCGNINVIPAATFLGK